MKNDILLIPIDRNHQYEGVFKVSFKKGDKLTNDYEVITVTLFSEVVLAIYNRDIASILVNGADVEFHWNEDTRRTLANYEDITFVDLFKVITNNKVELGM